MKKICLFVLLVMTAMIACKKDEQITTGIKPVNLTLQLSYPVDSNGYNLPKSGITVKIVNVTTGNTQTLTPNDTGAVVVNDMPVGTYDIDASITFSDTAFYRLTGVFIEDPITFVASQKGTVITVGSDVTVDLKLVSGTIGQWVIKQVYFAGSHRTNGALFRDQFIELYNNSDHVLYADSIYIAQAYARQNPITTTPNTYILGNGQVDWTYSVGMPANIDANNDYVYTRSILMIPGSGTTYPVQPGTSVIIAQTAINHQAPYTGVNGTTIAVRDPSLTVDLSGADFEAYYGNLVKSPLASDVDNPDVPNMEVLQYYGTDYILDNNGRDGYVIFKVDGTQTVTAWPSYNLPTLSTPSSTAARYIQVPVKYILDAVEVQPNVAEDRIPKKFGPTLDAGYTYIPDGAYTSQSVIRKTAKTVNGRVILQDTNNSTEDFDYLKIANPRGFK